LSEFFGTAGPDVVIYEDIEPIPAGDLLNAYQAQAASVLYGVRYKYTKKLYVNRAIEQELKDFFGATGLHLWNHKAARHQQRLCFDSSEHQRVSRLNKHRHGHGHRLL
jgi:hypothetical protein